MLGAKNGDFNPLLIINPSSLNSQFFTVKLKIARLLPDTKLVNIDYQLFINNRNNIETINLNFLFFMIIFSKNIYKNFVIQSYKYIHIEF